MFIPCKHIQDSIVFVGKAGAYSSETPFRPPGLAHKQLTRLEGLARSKHSSLILKLVTYDRKSFITLALGVEFTTLYFLRDFQKGPIS